MYDIAVNPARAVDFTVECKYPGHRCCSRPRIALIPSGCYSCSNLGLDGKQMTCNKPMKLPGFRIKLLDKKNYAATLHEATVRLDCPEIVL